MHHGIDRCVDVENVIDAKKAKAVRPWVNTGDPELMTTAAEIVVSNLTRKSPGVYRRWLLDTIGKLEPTNPEILHVLAQFPGILTTLNYDSLFAAATGRKPITWREPYRVEEVLRGHASNVVLHLHGHYENPDSVILGLRSYDKVKDDEHAKTVLKLFTISKTLLFVGCGGTVEDPNFSQLIGWASQALPHSTHRHYLLCREDDLDDIRDTLKPASWLYAVPYGKGYADLLPFLKGLLPVPAASGSSSGSASSPTSSRSPPSPPPSLDLAGYRGAMRKYYGRLKLEEMDSTAHDVKPLTIVDLFIPQNVRECAEYLPRAFELPRELLRQLRETGDIDERVLDEEMMGDYRRAYHDQSPRSALELFGPRGERKVVVLGDPGSGKTTLLQYLMLRWVEKSPLDAVGEPLPLLIELGKYNRARHNGSGSIHDFLDFLHRGPGLRWHFDREALKHWLDNQPSLVLFDGLDEIFDREARRETATAIHRFADEFSRASIVVSSRLIGYQHEPWRDEEFRHFVIQELDDQQIQDFTQHWHQSAYTDRDDGPRRREQLTRAIADSTAIRQLAGNPLLLTMMAILNRTQDLPRDRAELYDQCARLLLHQWKLDLSASDASGLPRGTLDYKDKRGLLARVARAMQTNPHGLAGNLIDEEVLEKTLAEGLKGSVSGLGPERAARIMIGQLRERHFMLCWLGGRSYAFVHRTFLEYFCAFEIHQRFQQDQTLTLEQLKTEIYGRHWHEEAWREVLCLIAGMISSRFVAEIIKFLLDQKDPDQKCLHIFLAASCVGEVRNRADLGTWAHQTNENVRRLTQFDLNYFYEPYDTEAAEVRSIRTKAVSVVANVWAKDAGTRTWLKTRAQTDDNGAVRQAAVQELARGWKDDPDTLIILKARAQNDEHYAVRQAAVQELARGWKDDPDTLTWLKTRAQNDESYDVRHAAEEGIRFIQKQTSL